MVIDHNRAKKNAETGQRGNLNSGFQEGKTGLSWRILQSDVELLSLLITSACIASFMQIVEIFFLKWGAKKPQFLVTRRLQAFCVAIA
jgi:hypothetical protein